MNEEFRIASVDHAQQSGHADDFINEALAQQIRDFHRSFPMYSPTPLVSLPDTAAYMGLGAVYVKNEAHRFGLNAFKVLGGSYAIARYLTDRLHRESIDYDYLLSAEAAQQLGKLTFITATDGNHGRGVAWAANHFGHNAVVYMPKGSVQERLANIRAAGATAEITDMNYDDTVRFACRQAEENGWILVQDTAFDGYEDIPAWIMQGYGTMGLEAYEQLPEKPTHIFLQAGVGSMAGTIAGLFASIYKKHRPIITVVEPTKADCFYRTAAANDGKLHFVTGDMDTIMAGLACGEPCPLAWDILKRDADHFISFPDYAAAKGMRMLGNPAGTDNCIVAGESGASAFGCVAEIMLNPALLWLKDRLQLNESSRVLFFNTEGATDTKNYRNIVWNGKFPTI